jgi:hypothetical protein
MAYAIEEDDIAAAHFFTGASRIEGRRKLRFEVRAFMIAAA